MLIKTIHPDDPMFAGSEAHYYSCGRQLSDMVEAIFTKYYTKPKKDFPILELPAGYGRVTRYLAQAFGASNIHTVDIYDASIAFQKEVLQTNVYKVNVGDFTYREIPDGAFKIAVMGSLITHFDEKSASQILKSFSNKLFR